MGEKETQQRPFGIRFAFAVGVPVLTAILITALTPVGDSLKELVSPTSAAVRGSVRMHGRPVRDALLRIDGEHEGVTATDGSFLVRNVSRGQHELTTEILGARTHKAPFFVKKGSEEKELGTIELLPSLRLAGQVSVALESPRTIMQSLSVWVEGDQDVTSMVRLVTFTLPNQIEPNPITSASASSKFCVGVTRTLQISDVTPGAVGATVALNDGRGVQLSVTDLQQLELGQKPKGCLSNSKSPDSPSRPEPPTEPHPPNPPQPPTPPQPPITPPERPPAPPTLLLLSKNTGVPGTEVQASGTGFGSTEKVSFTFGTTPLSETASTDKSGSFVDVTIHVPSEWPGPSRSVTVTATGELRALRRTTWL